MQPLYIAGYNRGGLVKDRKPFAIPSEAFSDLQNAWIYRDRVVKRNSLKLVGRLRRVLTGQALGNTDGAGAFSGNIITILSLETNAEIEPGSLSISDGTNTFTDDGAGNLTGAPSGSGSINYATGAISLSGGAASQPLVAAFNYYPNLPVMEIATREISGINNEQTIIFDTTYAYIYNSGAFQEFISGTTWSGTNADFFWTTNYRGTNPEDRLFFATNFVDSAANPMRYTNGSTWTTFTPAVDGTNFLLQARVLLPYYGRLIALNVYEGTALGSGSNIFNRCRFSQIGNPVAADAWRSDQFGKGGFIDAPTNEAIISAGFIKNTLIVYFERSTWQLRYVGEYGPP